MPRDDTDQYPKLLEDVPALTDTLGAHQRLANALATIVSKESGGKTVSIEGGWGTGKSTVVKLMTEMMSSKNLVNVVTYDAWVHSGDPLRRVFLTTLIDDLLRKNWLSGKNEKNPKEYWDEQKQKLERKLKISEKKTKPSLTGFGRLFAMSFLLIPIASPIFSEGMKRWSSLSPDQSLYADPIFWWLIVGAIAISAPLWISCIRFLIGWRKKEPLDQMFAILLSRATTHETTETLETPDPTTIEFQDLFGEALSQALGNKSRRLVLVIDNLDRTTEAEAGTVWSLLRSFIDNPLFQKEDWFKRLWVVVPVARERERTWRKKKEPSKQKMIYS